MNENDKDFIDKVWQKVNYLEQIRIEEEEATKFKKINRKKNIIVTLFFCIVICMILYPILLAKSIDIFYVFVLGVCILGFSAYYENYLKETS